VALKAFRGRPFEHTHENRAFNDLFDALQQHCIATEQDWYLLGNFFVGSRELDAMVIKPNALIIIDFKEFSGALQFSEEGPWLISRAETGDSVTVKGGASINPLRQLRLNKGAMLDFLSRNLAELDPVCNWRHTAALVAFQGKVEFDRQQLPGSIKPWFHISDSRSVVRDLDAIVSREIRLSPENTEDIVGKLGLEVFVPAGIPTTRELAHPPIRDNAICRLTTRQEEVLHDFCSWLQNGTGVFRVTGMASTGKRFLFPHLVDAMGEARRELLLLTPSVRISSTYQHPLAQPTSIYSWLYTHQPKRFEKQDDRQIGIHEIRDELLLEGRIPVLVDAHLLSDEEFEVGDRRYGSGRLLHDFLSVIAKTKAPFVIIGDPYQMPRGSLQRSLVSGTMLEQLGLTVNHCALTEQIVMDEDDALKHMQAHLADSLNKNCFNRLPRLSGKRLEIFDGGNARNWIPDVSNVRAESILICATHEQNSKLNAAVKSRVLGHANPTRLAAGDRIDFYNRTPILASTDASSSLEALRWVSSGELALVDSVDDTVETHFVELRGRKEAVRLCFQCAICRLLGLGEVRFRYLVDYFEADRPEVTSEQYLALQVLARQLARSSLQPLKAKLPAKQSPGYKEARAEYDRLEYQILQGQGYLSAALIRPAHAMTLHRAQGRRWPSVWVNAARSASSKTANNADYFRWLYTATVLAEEQCVIRQMPVLTPLSNACISRAHDLKIGPLSVRRGLFYDRTRKPTEQEALLGTPPGFSNIELLALFLTLHERLSDSDWRIADWSEYDFQVVVVLAHRGSTAKVRLRLHYDKQFAVSNLVFVDGSQPEQTAIRTLLCQPFRPQSETLVQALDAMQEQISMRGFSLVEARESNYRLQLTLAIDDEAVETQVDCDKEGMISSVRILKASSEDVIKQLEEALVVSA